MTVGIDACLEEISGGLFDFQIGVDGDIISEDRFDSSIIVSFFAERRANEAEVSIARQRRGWIGNEDTNFEIGSKLWLFEQSKLNSAVVNGVATEARRALQWLINDNFAESIDGIVPIITQTGLSLDITIRRPNSEVEKRHFVLWDNTASICDPITDNFEPDFIILTAFGGMNIFEEAGKPIRPVDVLVNVPLATAIFKADSVCIDTGIGWHADSTITIYIAPGGASIIGGGGAGGRGNTTGDEIGGGGGGGAPFGVGGTATAQGNDGNDGGAVIGGSGGLGVTIAGDPVTLPFAGKRGKSAILLQHDLTIINFGSIAGGGGGGGGGGASSGAGNGGQGGNAGFSGQDGTQAFNSSGGLVGKAIDLNDKQVTFIFMGTLLGEVS